jgi:putative oxidoreductase
VSPSNPIQRALKLALALTAALSFLAPLMTRFVLGYGFFFTGQGKWHNFENTVNFFTSLGIPYPQANAAFIATLELVGGLCLAVGLLTRLMSAGLASTMVVALLTADRADFLEAWSPASDKSPWDVSSLVLLLLLVWLVLFGPGAVSIDRFLAKKLGLSEKSPGTGPA